MILKILGGIAALALGVLLGLPGKSGPRVARGRRWLAHHHGRGNDGSSAHDEDEVEQLERDLGLMRSLSRRTKRHFTPLDLLGNRRRGSERRRTRRYFRTAAPSSRDKGTRPRLRK